MPGQIRVAIAGVGSCCMALIQGVHYYRTAGQDETAGLMHPDVGGYKVTDIVPVAAFDVDARKVGRDLSEAIFAPPNCAYVYPGVEVVPSGVKVMMGPVLDGVPDHLSEQVQVSSETPVDIVRVLKDTGADMLLNFLPTGSAQAVRFYVDAAIKEAKIGFINGMPELIVCDPDYAKAAEGNRLPLIGDDVKSQLGGTIIHRRLISLLLERGIKIKKSYQLNYAGNTDFFNLVRRGKSKQLTKTEALTSLVPYEAEISTGFSYVDLMKDRKTARFYFEAENFGGAPLSFEATLRVEDSANFAGVIVEAVRCCKLALDRGVGGWLTSASAYLMKHPPVPMDDAEARVRLEEFIMGTRER